MRPLRILLFLLSTIVVSAEAGTLSGTVVDAESQKPLELASVRLRIGDMALGKVTDAEGVFRFESLEAGVYVLGVSFIGYLTHTDTVTVEAEGAVTLDVDLVPEPVRIEPVEVRGERPTPDEELQVGVVSLDAKDLETIPGVLESDPIRSLVLLPGVQSASDFSSGLYVRGGGPDQTLVLLDRVTLYNPTHFLGFFSTFNQDVVENVSLYKGAYPAEYTGRLGSVLDVRTRTGNREKLRGQAGLSTIAGRAALDGPLWGGSFLLSGRRTYLDPILNALRKSDSTIPKYYFYDVNGKLTFPYEHGVVNASAYLGQDDLRFELTEQDNATLRWGNRTLSLGANRFLGDEWLGELQISGSEYESTTEIFIFGTPLLIDNQLRDASLRADLTRLGDEHTLRGGVQGALYDFTYGQTFNREVIVDFRKKPAEASLYFEDEWRGERTGVRGGLRARYFGPGDRVLLEPRFVMSRRTSHDLELKVGGGLYHQVLQLVSTELFSAGDFYFPIDASADPGRSWQAVLGATWDVSPSYQLAAEAYYTGLERLLIFDNDIPPEIEDVTADDIFITGGTGYATGLELFLQKRAGPVRGWVGYTLGWTRRKFDELNGGKEFPPKVDRRHDVSFVLTMDRGPWTFSASFLYGTGQAYTPAVGRYSIRNPGTGTEEEGGYVLPGDKNSARLLPYHRMDVGVTKDFGLFGLDAEWFVQAFNLYSRKNEWFVQFDPEDPVNEPEVVRQLPLIPSLGVNVAF